MKTNNIQVRPFYIGILFFLSFFSLAAQQTEIKTINGARRLVVKGEPFIMLSGELHNSTPSTYEYLSTTWQSLKAMHLNSVIVTVSWEQFEPQEGTFDYTMIDHIIELAEKHQMPTVIAWFGTWKNGESSYAPLWVRKDTKRFFRVLNKDREATPVISPFCQEACLADQKAFSALMQRIKDKDVNGMIAVMQVENEVGCFQDIDYCNEAQMAYKQEVPAGLINYFKKNEQNINPALTASWVANGKKTKGTWSDVFGVTDDSKHFFMTWHYASYIQQVARAGKDIHPLPMFVNAALPFNPNAWLGTYPNGGPVSKVIDIYKVAAPAIDWCGPDIYAPNFKDFCKQFHYNDNPLFIPETVRDAAPAFYAFAEHDAICYSPFAIEDAYLDKEFVAAYKVLDELLPVISSYQGKGKMRGFLREKKGRSTPSFFGGFGTDSKEEYEESATIQLGDYNIDIQYVKEEKKAYGLIIQTAPDEFIVAGLGAHIKITSRDNKVLTQYAHVWEGRLDGTQWITTCWLNGDQTGHHSSLYLRGRSNYSDKVSPKAGEIFPMPNPAVWESAKQEVLERIKAPGVYKVKVYSYEK